MTIDFDSNKIPSREEREERVLDLHFNQNKNYRQIAKEMKMSLRDIGEIVNRAKQEKERQEHKSLSVQAYDKFSKGKTPLQVAIDLNIGQAQATQYHWEYLKLVGLRDITKLYIEFKGDVSYFVNLCKAAKSANIGVPEVIKLINVTNNDLPEAEHRYERLVGVINAMEYNKANLDRELQYLNDRVSSSRRELYFILRDRERETSWLQNLKQQAAATESFVYNYKNNNEGYVEVIKSIENKISDFLSDKKTFLKIAIIYVIESMRNNPEKYSALVYHNNYNQSSLSSISKDNCSNLSDASRQAVVLPPPPYDNYMIEYYKDIMLEESEKFYNDIVGQLICEVVNENVVKQSAQTMPFSLPALPLEEGGPDDDKQN
jgi:hypothetical protein